MRNSITGDQATTDATNPVVQYTRMSTDHRRYSTEDRDQFVAEFAKAHEIEIVRSYRCDGKSELNIEGRQQLARLLRDMQRRSDNFVAVSSTSSRVAHRVLIPPSSFGLSL
ncbi:recombinase family protein [Burkholderia sp. BE17]|uniref:recombinase family protein n=1 Tax=Burkholderia sp. BE17 TaxID=2656644 RepID=UPI00128C5AB1|nr:recombinase family protein [Burkholderia sp. BE17]MPV67665.1 hypothetical protein [Burkholderia sp. BE17]